MERGHAAIRESDRPIWSRNAGRNVGIIKWIVKRITEEDKAAMMMVMCPEHRDASKPVPIAIAVGAIGIPVAIRSRGVGYVNPCFGRPAAHVAHHFLFRRTPRQPNRVFRHPGPNLSLAHQSLIARRESLINFRMIRNPRLGCGTACQDKSAGRKTERQCPGKKMTLHAKNHTAADL